MTDETPWPRLYVDYAQLYIIEIASECSFETLDTYEENIEFYEKNNYSYIPLPKEFKYFDRESNSLKEMKKEQWAWLENPAVPMMKKLEEHDFLLIYDQHEAGDALFYVDDGGLDITRGTKSEASIQNSYGTPEELLKEHPEYRDKIFELFEKQDCLYMVTLADLNDRRVRGVLYHLISSVEVVLSHAIKTVYPNGEVLIKHMNESSVGRWKKAEYGAGQLHPVEYTYFGELKHIASISEKVLDLLGYDSPDDFNDDLSGIGDFRNKIMHPSKNLVKESSEIEQINDKITRLERFIEKCGGSVNKAY